MRCTWHHLYHDHHHRYHSHNLSNSFHRYHHINKQSLKIFHYFSTDLLVVADPVADEVGVVDQVVVGQGDALVEMT